MQSVQQLDIFADSRDVMLRNDVLEQLQRRDVTAAQTALERLAGDYPDDDTLPAMTVLVHELARGLTALFADQAALASARRHPRWCRRPGGCWWRWTSMHGSCRAGKRSQREPRPCRFVASMARTTPRRCGLWRASGRPQVKRSRASNRGGASRHRSRG